MEVLHTSRMYTQKTNFCTPLTRWIYKRFLFTVICISFFCNIVFRRGLVEMGWKWCVIGRGWSPEVPRLFWGIPVSFYSGDKRSVQKTRQRMECWQAGKPVPLQAYKTQKWHAWQLYEFWRACHLPIFQFDSVCDKNVTWTNGATIMHNYV